jgi:7-carboxy-7-deazaguanine synthase
MTELVVNEIFHSIQGESSYAGRPCVFVRLSSCNLRCTWCDTAYAFSGGETMALDTILDRVASYRCNLVEVTGGEPLLQPGCLDLMTALCDAGYEVLLETGGSLDIGPVDARVHRIVDVKCPGSGMADRNRWSNLPLLTARDEVKFVIADRADFLWACEIERSRSLSSQCIVHFSPVFGTVSPTDLATWMLEAGVRGRLQIQLHKYLWDPQRRGV